jgi:hypothetical protein
MRSKGESCVFFCSQVCAGASSWCPTRVGFRIYISAGFRHVRRRARGAGGARGDGRWMRAVEGLSRTRGEALLFMYAGERGAGIPWRVSGDDGVWTRTSTTVASVGVSRGSSSPGGLERTSVAAASRCSASLLQLMLPSRPL